MYIYAYKLVRVNGYTGTYYYAEVYRVAQKIRLIFVCRSLYTLYIRVFPGLRITLK